MEQYTNMVGPAGGRGAAPSEHVAEFIEQHTTTSIWPAGAEETTCTICVEDLEEGDEIRTLPCGHVYHKQCVDEWLRRSRLCCLCKRPINEHGGASSSGHGGASSSGSR